MKKTLLLLALFASLTAAPTAFACSPAQNWPPSASENLASKDVAFIGTVTSIVQDKSLNGQYHITFAVDTTYKGSLEETVSVTAQSSSAACGYDDGYSSFKKGSVWAIYGMGNDADDYSTNSLSLNTSYKSVAAAKDALKDLGLTPVDDEPMMCTMIYQPVCGKAADGTIKTYGNSCTLAAEKATFVSEGECTVSPTPVPSTDLWIGMRGADVIWLQTYLIAKNIGDAAKSLASVGATGYFGSLTKAALASYQNAHSITPTSGYFGTKTRAVMTTESATTTPTGVTFTGKIEAVSTACFADGECSVTVDGKKVILLTGMRMNLPPVGSIKGVDSIGDLEKEIGSRIEVYATPTTENGASYTLYGDSSFYVKVLGK